MIIVLLIHMSHIRCFFCGKDSAVSGFEPSDLDLDLYIRQVRGRGYRRGFDYDQDESVLGDDYYTPKFFDRSIEFLKLLIEKGIISTKEIESRLNIGIPILNSEDVISYDDFITIQKNTIESLGKKNFKLRPKNMLSSNYVTKDSYNKLKKSFNDFRIESDLKKEIDNIIIELHNISDSKIIKEKDDWHLEIYDIDLDVHFHLYRQLYQMELYQRNMLQKRIKTNCYGIIMIFNFMWKEPTITSFEDALLKRPHMLYYIVHGYPIPRNARATRETFFIPKAA